MKNTILYDAVIVTIAIFVILFACDLASGQCSGSNGNTIRTPVASAPAYHPATTNQYGGMPNPRTPKRVGSKEDTLVQIVLKVKMQQIEDEKAKIEVDLKKIRKILYTSEAKLELLASKKKAVETKIAVIKENVKKLSQYISEAQSSESGSVEVKGKTYTKKDLQNAAEQITSKFENANIELEGYQQRLDVYTKSIALLKKQESAATDMLAKLDTKIKTIRTKRGTIESVQE